jgi:Skp family chaperone for outer membrane proteins
LLRHYEIVNDFYAFNRRFNDRYNMPSIHNYSFNTVCRPMKSTLTITIATGLVAALSGCNLSSGIVTSNQPLVVDIAAVARALGRNEAMQKQIDMAYKKLNTQLVEIGSELEQRPNRKKEDLETGNESGKADFDKLVLQANLQLKRTRQIAQKKGELYRGRLLNEFRQEVMGAARQIADKRDAVVVVAANNDILWYSSAIDITDETIGILRAQQDTGISVRAQSAAIGESAETQSVKDSAGVNSDAE